MTHSFKFQSQMTTSELILTTISMAISADAKTGEISQGTYAPEFR
jgi:hypothetical protein